MMTGAARLGFLIDELGGDHVLHRDSHCLVDRDLIAGGAPRLASAQNLAQLDASLGIEARAKSIGTTQTTHILSGANGATEIRPGNYVFYDATQVALELVPRERCALSVLGTVVARPSSTRLILDCGSKALAAERLTARTVGFGFVIGHEKLVVERLYEEHAIVTSLDPIEIPIGSRLRVVPNHSCATVNLHERMLIVEGEDVVDVWPVDARGWEAKA